MKIKATWNHPRDRKPYPIVVVGIMGNDDRYSLIAIDEKGKFVKCNKMDVVADVNALEEPRIGIDLARPGADTTVKTTAPSPAASGKDSDSPSSVGEVNGDEAAEPTVAADEDAEDRAALAKEYNKQQAQENKGKRLANQQAKT